MRIIPLGGIGEIGRNMTVFELDGQIMILDCGVLFPEETQPGVDLILPDFGYLEDKLDRIVGTVLTHGHEDHIGGIPYLLTHEKDALLVADMPAVLGGTIVVGAVYIGINMLSDFLYRLADPRAR